MNEPGISSLDETVQLSNRWLNQLMEAVSWDDNYRTHRLLRATLHALRDRLPAHEAVHLRSCRSCFGVYPTTVDT